MATPVLHSVYSSTCTGAPSREIVTREDLARQYVRRIRNAAKRQYADAYLDYWLRGGRIPETPAMLSVRDEQAVRGQLQAILPSRPEYRELDPHCACDQCRS